MIQLLRSAVVLLASVVIAHSTPASAQCAAWTGEFGPVPGFEAARVSALTVFDDGSGPALFAGGAFTQAPGAPANRIARWNGTQWSALGSGLTGGPGGGEVLALAVYDDGSGPALFAGGSFTTAGGAPAANIARWNGSTWSALGAGVGGTVRALCVFDSGNGPELVVGGDFTTAGGANASRIARWDGTTWSTLGPGMSNGTVRALATYDDGSGVALYAGGVFTSAGATVVNHVARWNGSSWSALATGIAGGPEMDQTVNPIVYALAVHDDGSGPALFLGGNFLTAGGIQARRIAKWTPSGFVPAPGFPLIPFEFIARVEALAVVDVGNGPELFAGGAYFTFAGRNITRLTPGGWASVGGGSHEPDRSVLALAGFESAPGTGVELYAGGNFLGMGTLPSIQALARYRTTWRQVVDANGRFGLDGTAYAMTDADLGSGSGLYVVGGFSNAGLVPLNSIGRLDASGWSALPPIGPFPIYAVTTFDDGSGPAIVAGGGFTQAGGAPGNGVARFDGTSWSALGSGVTTSSTVTRMFSFDDGTGPRLWVGGVNSAGGAPTSGVARWDGSTWTAFPPGAVWPQDLIGVADVGAGPKLYASVQFSSSTGWGIGRWNGSGWDVLGVADSFVTAVTSFDDGNGPALYFGGQFEAIDGVPRSRIARFDAGQWSSLGTGLSGAPGSTVPHVRDLEIYDDGTGTALYAAGWFLNAGGTSVSNVARWNGSSWSTLNGTISSVVNALHVFDDGSGDGPELYLAGQFLSAGGLPALRLAAWSGCRIESTCPGDGSLAACPCGNNGLAGRGCENASATGGAILRASGSIVPDTLVLEASGERPNAHTTFVQGTTLSGAVPFGDGLRCVNGPLKRMYSGNASGGAIQRPGPGDLSISARSALLGDPLTPGTTRYYFALYRDPNLAFCAAGSSFNLTPALRVVW